MKKPSTPTPTPAPIERQTYTIPEAAIYVGCTNWFMEELLRHDVIPWVQMGDHKAIFREDLDRWLPIFKKRQLFRQALENWQEEHPEVTDEWVEKMFMSMTSEEEPDDVDMNEEV